MQDNPNKGKRFINLLRCSTKEQDTSIEDQLALLDAYGERHEMVKVDDKKVPGVSGSVPARRKDIKELLERAKRKEYDVLLVHDLTRLTRGGVRYAYKLEWEFEQAGVKVVSATDNIPDGPAGEFYRTYKYQAGQDAVKRFVHDSTRTSAELIKKGLVPHCQKPPFGTDRMYCTREGTPKYRIRNLVDGRQLKLRPDSDEVIEEYAKKEAHQRRHLKQDDDVVLLVPGAPEHVRTIRHIFERHHVNGWGSRRICNELIEMGLVTSTGKGWTEVSVYTILRNPTYTGVGVANRTSKAVHFMRPSEGDKDPVPTILAANVLVDRENPPTIYRPKSDRVKVDHPHLVDLLPATIREKARAEQFEKLEGKPAGITEFRAADKHVDSSFVLKDILRSKQGDHRMVGSVSNPRKKIYRYYVCSKGQKAPYTGKALGRRIAAEPLEAAIIARLQDVGADLGCLRDRARALAVQRVLSARSQADQMDAAVADKERIAKKIEFIIDNFTDATKKASERKMAVLNKEAEDVDRRIARLEHEERPEDVDVDALADALVKEVAHLRVGLTTGCYQSIRKLVVLLVGRLVVDMDTKEVEIELRLPDWSISRDGVVRLDSEPRFGTTPEANIQDSLKISDFRCKYTQKRSNRCYACERQSAA